MFPFPDYYAQFGLILPKNISSTTSHYDIYEETIFIVVFLLLLSIEIFLSIIQVWRDWKKEGEKVDSSDDLLYTSYEMSLGTPSMTTKTSSTIEPTF